METGESWERISSRHVLREADMVVRKDVLRNCSDQSIRETCVLEYPDWVSAFALTSDRKVILVRQYRHGSGSTTLEIPGGWQKPDDVDSEAAIRRELREETGHAFDVVSLLATVSPNPVTHANWLHCYLATGGRRVSASAQDADERIAVTLFTLDRVQALLDAGKLIDNGHLTCVFLALLRLGALRWSAEEG